eukprot:m.1685828 g.1685828  ORF g.1685828 m.1685828 type:complete len:54 (-) comp257968_c0_seq1:23-184(-)
MQASEIKFDENIMSQCPCDVPLIPKSRLVGGIFRYLSYCNAGGMCTPHSKFSM